MKKLFAVILSLSLIIGPVPTAQAGTGAYAQQILGIANGIMGSNIITKCKLASMQPSLMAYMAGSLVYIFAEIAGGKEQKKNQSSSADSLNSLQQNMAQGGDFQKGVIKAQLNDQKKTLKHIKNRKKWLMAVKVIYGIATILALVEFWRSLPPPAGAGVTDQAACTPNPASDKFLTVALGYAYTGLQGYAGGGIMGSAMAIGSSMVAKKVGEFLFKTEVGAQAADAGVPILGSALGRVGFFAAGTILVQLIDSDLSKEKRDSEDRIAQLEKVLDEMDKLGNDNTEIAEGDIGSEGEDSNDPSSKTYALKALPKGQVASKSCFSSSSAGVNYSEAGCKNSIKFSKPKIDANLNLPTLTAGVNAAHDLGQAISDGDMAKADVAAGNLAAMAGRIDAIKDQMMKKTNDKLVAEGKKPVDVNAELQRQVDNLNSALNKASVGSGNMSLAKADEANVSSDSGKTDGEVQEIQTASTKETVTTPANDGLSFNEDDLLGAATDAAGEEKLATLSESLNNFESNESDIQKDPAVSIFKQVSNRYFLNYTKLFEKRKRAEPPMAEASPTN